MSAGENQTRHLECASTPGTNADSESKSGLKRTWRTNGLRRLARYFFAPVKPGNGTTFSRAANRPNIPGFSPCDSLFYPISPVLAVLQLPTRPSSGRFSRASRPRPHKHVKSGQAMAATSQLVQIELGPPVRQPKPAWLRARLPAGENFHNLQKLARDLGLHTVCESAQCPNIGECWNHRTATFMLLGDICTRRCGFCAVPKGRPEPIDWNEPHRVAEAVATLGLKHAVVTSVNRDDDNIGSARIFAETIREIRELTPDCRIEVLIPDFQGLEESLRIVLDSEPNVLNHNTETVPRLYRAVRSGARYERTLALLENAKKFSPGMVTKSGVMVGLGESSAELGEVVRDLGTRGVDMLTVGQYRRPSKDHLPIARFYGPQ